MCTMISMEEIMETDFPKLPSTESVGAAVEAMEEMNVDHLLVEEEGKIHGMATSHGLIGYPASRLILDCTVEPVAAISGKASPDEALEVLEREKVDYLVVLNGQATPIGAVNRRDAVSSLCQELRNSNKEKEERIAGHERTEGQLRNAYQELKETHAQLLQACKLAAMGEMAAGAAHELTQPLLGIKGFVTAMLEDIKQYPSVETPTAVHHIQKLTERTVRDLEVVLQQTDRMTAIVNNMRHFAHASGTQMAPLDINQPIEDALMLFCEQLRLHRIEVETNLGQGLPQVMGNSNQLQQVFVNLISNARDAIDAAGDKGRLSISTTMSTMDDSVVIEFEDNGIGADAETICRMFQPFFTTKPSAKGAGLGLSIVARIIKEHGGTICVQSEPGHGCTSRMRLPALNSRDGGEEHE